MVKVRVYFEGSNQLRQGFKAFLMKCAGQTGRSHFDLEVVAAQNEPIEDFQLALQTHADSTVLLLLDSEEPLDAKCVNLKRIKRLRGINRNHIFWMVQLMEAWFLADHHALQTHFKRDFRHDVLPQHVDVETIPKQLVLKGLKELARKRKKGAYHKVQDGSALLNLIDPVAVASRAPECRRLCQTLQALAAVNKPTIPGLYPPHR